jgi:diguanylate cyclase (GGDEF)-like protein
MSTNDAWMDDTQVIKDSAFNRRVSGVRQTQFNIRAMGTAEAEQQRTGAQSVVSAQPLFQQQVKELTDEEIDARAFYDQATHAYNLRYLVRMIQQEVVRAETFGRPLSILVVSIDNFKNIGMEYGTLGMDKSQAAIAATLMGNCRKVDMVGKYTDSRFIVVCPELGVTEASQMAAHMTTVCGQLVVPHQWHSIKLSVSVGIASLGEYATDFESLIALGDLGADMVSENGGNGYFHAPDAA